MDIINNIDKYMGYAFTISTLLFIISEGLAQIPVVKSNSIFQVIHSTIKKLMFVFLKKNNKP